VLCARLARRYPALLALLALAAGGPALAPVPLHAASPAPAGQIATAPDPVVAEVLRLLESGIGEPVVLSWLAAESRPPGRPTADELIALKRAGATDALIAALLDRVAKVEGTPAAKPSPASIPEPTPAPTPRAQPETEPARVASPAPEAAAEPASAPIRAPQAAVPPPATDAPEAQATVTLSLSALYVHWPEEGEPWDLVVYLDGEPFAPLPAALTERSAERRLARRDVAPGLHVLRWSQERHGERSGERGLHGARFDPEPLPFTLAAGANAEVAFEFRDPSGLPFARRAGPVTVRVAQGGREIAARIEGGGDAARWPDLCEEIEANLEGRKASLQERQLLKRCLRWADLWSALPPGSVSDRAAARRLLANP
jgi:hypothetical protein